MAKATKRSGCAAQISASVSFWIWISFARHVAVRRVPVGVDAERLDVDALLVHRAEALLGVLT